MEVNHYYLIKIWAMSNTTKDEWFTYLGKGGRAIGWIGDCGVKRYTRDDVRRYGYKRPPWKKMEQVKRECRSPDETCIVTIIYERA